MPVKRENLKLDILGALLYCTTGQFSESLNIVPEMTNYCAVRCCSLHRHQCLAGTLTLAGSSSLIQKWLYQCFLLVNICSMVWNGHDPYTVSTARTLFSIFPDHKDVGTCNDHMCHHQLQCLSAESVHRLWHFFPSNYWNWMLHLLKSCAK